MTNSPGQLRHLGETKQVHVKRLQERRRPRRRQRPCRRRSQPGSIDKMWAGLAAMQINQSIN